MNEGKMHASQGSGGVKGPVIYWMSRDQRVHDNWALLHAQEIALSKGEPLAVVFCLVPSFLNAAARQYGFMLKGLEEIEGELARLDVPFLLLEGSPEKEIVRLIDGCRASVVVTDFDPLRIKRGWKKAVGRRIPIPFYEVDAHNIVSCFSASPKQEYSAYTLRLKLKKLLPKSLEDYPPIRRHPVKWPARNEGVAWREVEKALRMERSIPEVQWIIPGEKAARRQLAHFIERKLAYYDTARNDPSKDGQSDLSPYLHFGQLSAHRVALEVQKCKAPKKAKHSFIEELIIRRELADNFCCYNPNYDSFEGFPEWAKKTLDDHRSDAREYVYSREQFEKAATHDDLWNAAQMEMIKMGKMHGYMRMYWCKKILEWSKSPEDAMRIAIFLNDSYELDGRDPNGYAGIAWSIGGVHDRPWPARAVYGTIRSMSYAGCRSKFDVRAYIDKVKKL